MRTALCGSHDRSIDFIGFRRFRWVSGGWDASRGLHLGIRQGAQFLTTAGAGALQSPAAIGGCGTSDLAPPSWVRAIWTPAIHVRFDRVCIWPGILGHANVPEQWVDDPSVGFGPLHPLGGGGGIREVH